MKICGLFFALIIVSSEALALNADYSAYLRGGTGANLLGGKQECFYNSGISYNFLRLGNECSFYSELAFVFNHVKTTAEDPFFFFTQVRLAFTSLGTRQWEAASNRDINQVEAFVKAGGIAEIPGALWVGKRFYRDVDVNIFDWYYYADMSGVGAGIEDIPISIGKFSFAHLIQADDTVTKSSVGRPALQAFDFRWKEILLTQNSQLNFWGVFASAPRGTDANGKEYVQTNGFSLASRLNLKVFGGNNNFALMYGKGAMKDLNIYGSATVDSANDKQNRAYTWRLVNDWSRDIDSKDINSHWGLAVAFSAENSDDGSAQDSHKEWQDIGIRPIYFVTDRFQLVFETGYSRVNVASERNSSGDAVGPRTMSRLTLAPQLSLNKSIWGRPVMRAYLTQSIWNDANKTFITSGAPSFGDKTAGTSIGYQFEVWF